ncbi:MAG TPA: indolepyruvate oxidoreductase subunit beta [Clostridiales bacterium]|nr:indolepyruvate oxidoreductase subunit beta [Clostridiales bacterium]
MSGVKNVILCGVGGQGTILASRILSICLIEAGYDVKMSEIHGMSQRGGNVTTQVRYGEKVYSPIIGKGSADVLVAFEKLEALRNLSDVRTDGGTVIINDFAIQSLLTLQGAMEYPDDAAERVRALVKDTKVIDATGLATDLGNPKAANIVLLGATVKALGLESLDWDSALEQCVKPEFLEMNKLAFKAGLEA